MKVNIFEVTSRRVAILGWSVSLCVVFMLLQLSEKYGQHIDELTADGFSVADTASKVTPLLWLCGLLVPFCSLLAWEQLRHALLKANHYWLQLMQIVVMVLTFLGVVVAVIPSDTAQMVHGTSLLGGFAKFQLEFPFYNNMAIGIVNFASAIYVGWRVLHLFIYERGWTYVASVRYLSHYNVGCSVCASAGFVGVNV